MHDIKVMVRKYTTPANDGGGSDSRSGNTGASASSDPTPRSAKIILGRKVIWVTGNRTRLGLSFDSLHCFINGLDHLILLAAAIAITDAAKLEIIIDV